MGSLQEQMLKSGLVSEEQLAKTRREAARKQKRKPKQRKAERQAGTPPSEAARAANEAKAQQRARDRELNKARNAERERKAMLAQLRVLLDEHRLNDGDGDIKHFYQSGRKVKQIWVTKEQQEGLVGGRLIVAVLEGRGHLLRSSLEERLRKIDPEGEHIRVVRADDKPAADDAYADHPIPDDLMW